MADTFSGEVTARLRWTWTSEDEISTDEGLVSTRVLLADGTDENEADAAWHASDQELLDSATVSYDLTALTRSLFGDTHTTTFVTVRALLIQNKSTSDGTLVVGNSGGNEWSAPFGADGDTVKIPPNGQLLLASLATGWDVDASNNLLKLAASGGDVDYTIVIIGTITASSSASSS